MGITFTIDVEAFETPEHRGRVEATMDRILEFLDERGVRATAFVVGTLAVEQPDLVRKIVAGGHEIGLHGHEHRVLDSFDPSTFAAESRTARDQLAEIAGTTVDGYRAPFFSLTPATSWAPQALLDAGFRYSSSVLPSRSPRGHIGYPGAPRGAFRWPGGLLELPCPVYAGIPVGGAYLRLVPNLLTQHMIRRASRNTPWLYVHAYDFDAQEPFTVMPDTSWLESRLLFMRRRVMFTRVARALRSSPGPPLGDRVPDLLAAGLPTFSG